MPRACMFLFVATCLYVVNELALGFRWPGDGVGWPDALLVIFAAATTLMSLARRLPWQNVVLAAAIIAVMGALSIWPAASGIWHPESGIGHLKFPTGRGPRFFGVLPWAVPFVWVIVLLNSRGAAQLILRRRRGTANFGWEVFGLTAALVMLLLSCLLPFATSVEKYWEWVGPSATVHWYGTPWWAFAVLLGVTVCMLPAVTPVLLDKRPDYPPADFHPMIMWVFLNSVFAAGSVARGMSLAVVLHVGAAIGSGVLAVRVRQSGLPARSNDGKDETNTTDDWS